MTECQCRCHVNPGAGCDQEHDKGSSGVVGVWSCSPCDKKDSCHHCGARPSQPHTWVEGDCVLPHRNHSRKLVDGAFVCRHCVDKHGDWLTEIVELYATIGQVIPHGSIPDDTESHKHTKRTGSPAPWRIDAWAIAFGQVNDHRTDDDGETIRSAYLDGNLPDFAAVLSGWCDAVNEHQGVIAVAPGTVAGAAAFLRINGEKAAGMPGVDDYDAELRWLRRCLRDAHAISEPQPLFRCLSVGCNGEVWPAPSEHQRPRCSRCQRRYSVHDAARAEAQRRFEQEQSTA